MVPARVSVNNNKQVFLLIIHDMPSQVPTKAVTLSHMLLTLSDISLWEFINVLPCAWHSLFNHKEFQSSSLKLKGKTEDEVLTLRTVRIESLTTYSSVAPTLFPDSSTR